MPWINCADGQLRHVSLMPRYRVEALKRTALGLHDTVGFLEFDAPDLPTARGRADEWLRAEGFDQTKASDARIVIGDLIVAEKEIGVSTWASG
jgi:hypothetical protein